MIPQKLFNEIWFKAKKDVFDDLDKLIEQRSLTCDDVWELKKIHLSQQSRVKK